ncbi:hypothetical protein ENBRE01_1045 [Enteropsectra breve]|nr:hypothetical protein ENBRE01_1045 [Enteropsectra breve]
MLGFGKEKKDAVTTNPESVVVTENALVLPEASQPALEKPKMGFFRKVSKNLDNYKMGWFKTMLLLDIIVTDADLICDFANRGEKLMPICGLLIILAINFIGIADFKIASYKVGLLTVTFFEALLLGLMYYADSEYLDISVILPSVATNVLCGFLQLIHACFAAPKAVPLDI